MVVTPSGKVMWVTVFWYGLTMSSVMNIVSSEKVKWVLLIITCGMLIFIIARTQFTLIIHLSQLLIFLCSFVTNSWHATPVVSF